MRSSKLLILAACCASHIALVPLTESLAHAADASSEVSERGARVSELNEAGAKYYSARSYRRAIEKFIEAYAIDRDPNLLFNIARCYEELGETAAAIEKYRRSSRV